MSLVIEIARAVEGYLIPWPKMEAYFIDNIVVDPARQGLELGRQLMEYAVLRSEAELIGNPALHQPDNDKESCDVRPYGFVEPTV